MQLETYEKALNADLTVFRDFFFNCSISLCTFRKLKKRLRISENNQIKEHLLSVVIRQLKHDKQLYSKKIPAQINIVHYLI